MKKIYSLLLVAFLTTPFISFSQGIVLKTTDPLVESAEANRKSDAPFSIYFNAKANYKEKDAGVLFNKYLFLRTNIDELRFVKKDVAKEISVSHYAQYFKGIKVEHGSYTITSKNENVSFITGDFYTINSATNVIPTVTKSDALNKALSFVGASLYKWQIPDEELFLKKQTGDSNATYLPKAELVLVEDFMKTGDLNGKVFLAYKFNIYAHTPISRRYIYIDAVSGKVLLENSIIKHHSKNNNIKKVENSKSTSKKVLQNLPFAVGNAATKYSGAVTIPTRLVTGSYRLISSIAGENYPLHTLNLNKGSNYGAATEFTDLDNNWTAAEFNNANFDNVALDAHWGAAKVFDYWKNVHARSSYDGAGAVINSYVHLNTNYDNAFWDGAAMSYGDGTRVNGGFLPLTALDVCGHEVGHAVCDYVVGAGAGLTYNRESGAMNEGFSDIWGAAIEHYSDPFESDAVAKKYFDIGEEIGMPLPTPLRSMSNPNLFTQPDTYLGTNWVDASTAGCPTPSSNTNDNCGVHTNSGVLNFWFYLLVSGGSGVNDIGNAYGVPSIGWTNAEKIAFLGEQNLTPTANYAACRTAMINAAITLFGACSMQEEAVIRAWYAVGVGANFIPCNPQISFVSASATVAESVASTTCATATKTITIPLKIAMAPTGGNATATIFVSGGTATNGADYILGTTTATFAAGSTANQNVTITLNDDGNIESNETIILGINVAANGSNAAIANTLITQTITITDNDKIEELGGAESHSVGNNTTALNNTSPFHSISRSAKVQYIISAADLLNFGIKPNAPFSKISVNVTTKNSTQAFTGYTISLANTIATNVSTGWITGLTQVFNGNVTTVVGVNNFNLSPATFSWDGTSNLAIQICYANGSTGTANDATDGFSGSIAGTTTWVQANNATGCGIAFSATNNTSFTPLFTFTQVVAPTPIETAITSERQWTINESNSTDNFYSTADAELIAKIKNNNANLGCVTAAVTAAGNGFSTLSAPYATTNRSLKEITITPSLNGSTTSYNATIYYTNAELAGKSPSTLLIAKTNAATDNLITSANTVFKTPTLINGSNYTGFSADFTGFSRFFLVDNLSVLPLNNLFVEAYLQNGNAIVRWTTMQENNSDYFIVEKSLNGTDFFVLTQKDATGFSSTEKQYFITDANVLQKNQYYRIKLVSTNGSIIQSEIVSIKLNNKFANITIMPNPVQEVFTIQYNNNKNGIIKIVDATGRVIKNFKLSATTGSFIVDASNFAKGIYIATMITDDNETITQKFIKN